VAATGSNGAALASSHFRSEFASAVRPLQPRRIQVFVILLEPAAKDGAKFLNPIPTEMGGLSLVAKVLPQYLRNKEQVEPRHPLGPFTTDAAVYATPPASGLRVTWFGHSSSLVELDGYRVLIDPVWDLRASPFTFAGPKRFFAPTIALRDLPKLDAILISHDHYDHLGADTVRQLAKLQPRAQWITSLGVGKRLRGFGVTSSITELNWTQSCNVGELRIAAWPARHFSGRGVLDRFKTLWSSFVLEGPRHRVYFGADSGYWDGFAAIAQNYSGFDLTMLEIGAFHPLWANIHLGPDNAARAFTDMGRSGLLMPIHWGLFNLALHGWQQPIQRMLELAGEQSLPLWTPTPGQPTEVLKDTPHVSDWWQDDR
jgi:L-ascorbate metabolism protein UlaG (beta-lactamase superfamily)